MAGAVGPDDCSRRRDVPCACLGHGLSAFRRYPFERNAAKPFQAPAGVAFCTVSEGVTASRGADQLEGSPEDYSPPDFSSCITIRPVSVGS
jgi:hypothetical protein